MRSNRAAVLIGLAALFGVACGGSSSDSNPTKQFKLTVAKAGAQKDNGTVSGSGINCGTTCSVTVDEGTKVTLTAATTAASAGFAGFSGAGCTTSPCVVTVSADTTVTATFNLSKVNLRVFSWGGGTTTPAAGIHPYDYGTVVTVTATAGTGATFTGWSDGTSQATTTVTLNGEKLIGARFYDPSTASDTWTLPVPTGSIPAATSSLAVLPWAGFKAAVSYTFDDARVSQAEGATSQDVGANYKQLADTGTPMTFYISPSQVERHLQFWKGVAAAKQEIANHTEDHCQVHTDGTLVLPPLASGEQGCAYTYGESETTQNAMREIDAANAYIKEKLGQDVFTMASPYGDGKWAPFAQAAGMIMMRAVWSTGNTDHNYVPALDLTNQFNVPGVWFGPVEEFDLSKTPPPSQGKWGELGNSPEVINKVIDDVRTAGGWSTFLIHRLTPSTYDGADGCCDVPVASLVASMNHIKNDAKDVWAGRVVDVAAYWIGQKLVKDATMSSSGGVMTYSWTLPANFPPGKFVRVTIDGATLAQRGHELTKAAGGYYEVALDAGQLTVTPLVPPTMWTLTVTKDGAGAGVVSGGGLNCGATCEASVVEGTVTLTATPDASSKFTGWTGGCTGTATTCEVAVSAATTVNANFAPAYDCTLVTGLATIDGGDTGVGLWFEPKDDANVNTTLNFLQDGVNVATGVTAVQPTTPYVVSIDIYVPASATLPKNMATEAKLKTAINGFGQAKYNKWGGAGVEKDKWVTVSWTMGTGTAAIEYGALGTDVNAVAIIFGTNAASDPVSFCYKNFKVTHGATTANVGFNQWYFPVGTGAGGTGTKPALTPSKM